MTRLRSIGVPSDATSSLLSFCIFVSADMNIHKLTNETARYGGEYSSIKGWKRILLENGCAHI